VVARRECLSRLTPQKPRLLLLHCQGSSLFIPLDSSGSTDGFLNGKQLIKATSCRTRKRTLASMLRRISINCKQHLIFTTLAICYDYLTRFESSYRLTATHWTYKLTSIFILSDCKAKLSEPSLQFHI
jgi:hypothetical protein